MESSQEEAEIVFAPNKSKLLDLSEHEEGREKYSPQNHQKEEEEKEYPLARVATPLVIASMHSSESFDSDEESSKSPSKDPDHSEPGLPLASHSEEQTPGQAYREFWKVRPSCSQETSHRLGRPISVDTNPELNRTYSQDDSESQSASSKKPRKKPTQPRRPGQMRRPRRRAFSGIPPDLKFDFSGIES